MEANYDYVLGVDPGTTTGLAVARFERDNRGKPTAVLGAQLEWQEAATKVEQVIEEFRILLNNGVAHSATVVREQFIINAQTAQRGQKGADDALGMNGVVRRNCELAKIDCPAPQQASAAKKLVTDDTLKRLDIYAPGLVHVNDAYRHALLYAVKQKTMNVRWLAIGLNK